MEVDLNWMVKKKKRKGKKATRFFPRVSLGWGALNLSFIVIIISASPHPFEQTCEQICNIS